MQRILFILAITSCIGGCLSIPHRADTQATNGAAGVDQSTETKISGLDVSKNTDTKVTSQGDVKVDTRTSGLDASQNPKARSGTGDAKSQTRTSGVDFSRNEDLSVRSRGPTSIQQNDPVTSRIIAGGLVLTSLFSYPIGKVVWLVGGSVRRKKKKT